MRQPISARPKWFLTVLTSLTVLILTVVASAPAARALTAPVLSVGTVTSTSIVVNWTDAGDEQSYYIYRGTSPTNLVKVDTRAPSVHTYTHLGLTPGVTYFLRVDAKKGGTTLESNVVQATTGGSTTTTPPPPGCVGVNVPITANLRSTFALYGGGTTYCLAAGTCTVPDTTDTTELRMDAGDVVWGAGQGITIIDGSLGTNSGRAIAGATGGAMLSYTFRDLSIGHSGRWINPANPCPFLGDCGRAFASGKPILLNLRCFDNGTVCVGPGVVNVTMTNVECDGNGWHPEALSSGNGACIKLTRGSATIRNSNIHDNLGNGVWCDFCDNGPDVQIPSVWLVENNQINHNGHAGVVWEVSGFWLSGDNIIVRNNTIQNNGWNAAPYADAGNGVLINDGVNADVGPGNIFGGNQWYSGSLQCCRAVRIIDGTRQPGSVYNISVHDNTLNGDLIFSCTAVGVTCSNNT